MPFDDPSDSSVSRRAFLGTGLAVAGGLVVAGSVPAFAASKTRVVAIPFSSDLYASPDPQRFTLVLQQGGSRRHQVRERAARAGAVQGPRRHLDEPDRRWCSTAPACPKGRGVYHSLATFGQAGIWDGEASFSGTTVEVLDDAPGHRGRRRSPARRRPGRRHPPRPRPSASSRSAPASRSARCTPSRCRTSSAPGKPVAVLFATPALCASQYCGPVLDEMLAIMKPYERPITFVHVDIYKDLTGDARSRPRSRRGRCRASRGSSPSTAPARSCRASTPRSGRKR